MADIVKLLKQVEDEVRDILIQFLVFNKTIIKTIFME